jgi:hypothetical protein
MKLNKYKTARNGIRRIVIRRTVERSKAAVSFDAKAVSIRGCFSAIDAVTN